MTVESLPTMIEVQGVLDGAWTENIEHEIIGRILMPYLEGHLIDGQAIADTWNNPHGIPEQEAIDNVHDELPELAALLDALKSSSLCRCMCHGPDEGGSHKYQRCRCNGGEGWCVPVPVLHCWTDFGDATCVLLKGHDGDHDPTPDDEIFVAAVPEKNNDHPANDHTHGDCYALAAEETNDA